MRSQGQGTFSSFSQLSTSGCIDDVVLTTADNPQIEV